MRYNLNSFAVYIPTCIVAVCTDVHYFAVIKDHDSFDWKAFREWEYRNIYRKPYHVKYNFDGPTVEFKPTWLSNIREYIIDRSSYIGFKHREDRDKFYTRFKESVEIPDAYIDGIFLNSKTESKELVTS